jgi:hypothetical protein
VAPLPFAPALARTFAPGALLRVAFDVWRQEPADAQPAITVVDTQGTRTLGIDRTLGAARSAHVEVPLALTGVRPGAYSLRIVITEGAQTTETDLVFSVR